MPVSSEKNIPVFNQEAVQVEMQVYPRPDIHVRHGHEGLCGPNCEHSMSTANELSNDLFADIENKNEHGHEGLCGPNCEHSVKDANDLSNDLFASIEKKEEHGHEGPCGPNCEHSMSKANELSNDLFADIEKKEKDVTKSDTESIKEQILNVAESEVISRIKEQEKKQEHILETKSDKDLVVRQHVDTLQKTQIEKDTYSIENETLPTKVSEIKTKEDKKILGDIEIITEADSDKIPAKAETKIEESTKAKPESVSETTRPVIQLTEKPTDSEELLPASNKPLPSQLETANNRVDQSDFGTFGKDFDDSIDQDYRSVQLPMSGDIAYYFKDNETIDNENTTSDVSELPIVISKQEDLIPVSAVLSTVEITTDPQNVEANRKETVLETDNTEPAVEISEFHVELKPEQQIIVNDIISTVEPLEQLEIAEVQQTVEEILKDITLSDGFKSDEFIVTAPDIRRKLERLANQLSMSYEQLAVKLDISSGQNLVLSNELYDILRGLRKDLSIEFSSEFSKYGSTHYQTKAINLTRVLGQLIILFTTQNRRDMKLSA
jgi:hypothetical protein